LNIRTIEAEAPQAPTTSLSDHQVVGTMREARSALSSVLDAVKCDQERLRANYAVLVGEESKMVFAVTVINGARVNIVVIGTSMVASCSDIQWRKLVNRRVDTEMCSRQLAASRLLREFLSAELGAYLAPRS